MDQTEVWMRNPTEYMRECVSVGVNKIIWWRGVLVKHRIDPIAHARMYYGLGNPYRIIVCEDDCAIEYREFSEEKSPFAVYPRWNYGDSAAVLEDLCETNVGRDVEVCGDLSIPKTHRPVLGQEHRIIISHVPLLNSGPGRQFMRYLKSLQEDHPQAIIHLNGKYAFRQMFATGLGAADFEARSDAMAGRIYLTSGKVVMHGECAKNPKWMKVMGFTPGELSSPSNRIRFNIKSALWCGESYNRIFNFRVTGGPPPDVQSPDAAYEPLSVQQKIAAARKERDGPKLSGDKFHCDHCSLTRDCRYYREGSVCTLPGSESKELASFFRTRDADLIIDGLGDLLGRNAERLKRNLDAEEVFGEADRHVTTMMGQVFDQGVKLAKLIDPNLRGGPRVQVNVGGNSFQQTNPRELVAAAFKELESQGIPREKITPEMIENLLRPQAEPQVITGTVV